MDSKAKIFGHALHPMLIAFPTSFYAATVVAYAAYAATGDAFWFRLGVVANIAGVAGAVVAAVPGLIDWTLAIPDGHPAKTVGFKHMLLNGGALVLFGFDALLSYQQWGDPGPAVVSSIVLAMGGMVLTTAAGALGWRLVQKHHVAIDPIAEQAHERPSEPAVATAPPGIPLSAQRLTAGPRV